MTKADQIRQLAAKGKSAREIAIEVYSLSPLAHYEDVDRKAAYVRVVLRQRIPERCPGGKSVNDIEIRYAVKKFGSLYAYGYYKNHAPGAAEKKNAWRRRKRQEEREART